uniref:PDZ domain-containing protein n=1 Tax=Amphora coffeiformis TaxID=265554 RepID=A0A7S3KWS2_9STRA|mmetsp:Transcript_3430/g.6863  ORF Transcript_3430/g.6863 Transcript_3430/m.6863 type:complete len:631 (+) Transcript_3430:210-2102(+)
MSTASYREQHPPNLATSVDADYDYRAGAAPPTPTPTSASARGMTEVEAYKERTSAKYGGGNTNGGNEEAADGEEALLDLVQLEELHQEAERMKALGNKHMAAQEFTRAYNAYSAALQLSPVGPSSHVFLSNRAAALLSLKRYAAAATDAKRAVALAPTFGKAHARLGQALYFQKDYAGAVKAYEDAIEYEPDNNVTQTYLEKAKAKLEKQNRRARGEEVSVADTTQFTAPASVVTDVNRSHGVVQSGGYRGTSDAVVQAVARKPAPPSTTPTSGLPPTPRVLNPATTPTSQMSSPLHTLSDLDMDEDPDFEEALKIQIRANRFLANKQYKFAIEEYTAALFLVPDDKQLSPDLHLGRAHALNGSRRHESARNDAMLAIRLNPTPAAYSTLAKSLFYMKDYQGAVKAFQGCIDALPEGENLGMFDQAYLQKAEAALEEQSASLSLDNRSRASTKASTVPKLPPPRFVPREEAMQQTHNLPSMPKQWPQQIPSSPTALRCGPERDIIFLSESLGIKLNRGPDGIVRVLSVAPHTAGSPVARDGAIYAGDVVREAAGVDIRRPITNVMWGDTVALIKMAPRPITLVVAKELSEVPTAVIEEQRRAQTPTKPASPANYRPSPANGDESVGQRLA